MSLDAVDYLCCYGSALVILAFSAACILSSLINYIIALGEAHVEIGSLTIGNCLILNSDINIYTREGTIYTEFIANGILFDNTTELGYYPMFPFCGHNPYGYYAYYQPNQNYTCLYSRGNVYLNFNNERCDQSWTYIIFLLILGISCCFCVLISFSMSKCNWDRICSHCNNRSRIVRPRIVARVISEESHISTTTIRVQPNNNSSRSTAPESKPRPFILPASHTHTHALSPALSPGVLNIEFRPLPRYGTAILDVD